MNSPWSSARLPSTTGANPAQGERARGSAPDLGVGGFLLSRVKVQGLDQPAPSDVISASIVCFCFLKQGGVELGQGIDQLCLCDALGSIFSTEYDNC